MRRITIIKVIAILTVAFATVTLSGYLGAETNNTQVLSKSEMQVYIGQQSFPQCWCFIEMDCQQCYGFEDLGISSDYTCGEDFPHCDDEGTAEQQCDEDYEYTCGLASEGCEGEQWFNSANCGRGPGNPPPDYTWREDIKHWAVNGVDDDPCYY